MGYKIILKNETFKMRDFNMHFPTLDIRKKIVFQAELESIEGGTAVFRIIGYPAWYMDKEWKVGPQVRAYASGSTTSMDISEPLGFANNELLITDAKRKKKKSGKNKKDEKQKKKFMKFYRKVSCDPKCLEEALFHCKTFISENPHLRYDVTLESGGTTEQCRTNPSPPGNPSF